MNDIWMSIIVECSDHKRYQVLEIYKPSFWNRMFFRLFNVRLSKFDYSYNHDLDSCSREEAELKLQVLGRDEELYFMSWGNDWLSLHYKFGPNVPLKKLLKICERIEA